MEEVVELAADLADARAKERAAFELVLENPSSGKANSRLNSARKKVDKLMTKLTAAEASRDALVAKTGVQVKESSKVTKAIPEIETLHSDLQTEKLQLLAEPLVDDAQTGPETRTAKIVKKAVESDASKPNDGESEPREGLSGT